MVELDVGANPIGDAGLERFVTMKEAQQLQRLGVPDCGIGDDGLELIAPLARPPRRGADEAQLVELARSEGFAPCAP